MLSASNVRARIGRAIRLVRLRHGWAATEALLRATNSRRAWSRRAWLLSGDLARHTGDDLVPLGCIGGGVRLERELVAHRHHLGRGVLALDVELLAVDGADEAVG